MAARLPRSVRESAWFSHVTGYTEREWRALHPAPVFRDQGSGDLLLMSKDGVPVRAGAFSLKRLADLRLSYASKLEAAATAAADTGETKLEDEGGYAAFHVVTRAPGRGSYEHVDVACLQASSAGDGARCTGMCVSS